MKKPAKKPYSKRLTTKKAATRTKRSGSKLRKSLRHVSPRHMSKPMQWFLSVSGCVFAITLGLYLNVDKLFPTLDASTVSPITVEAESMTWKPTGVQTTVNDTSVSGSKAVKLVATGAGMTTTTSVLSTAATQINVVAKGDQCDGAPSLQVKLDGTVIGSQDIAKTAWTQYIFPAKIAAGSHQVEVSFTNPYKSTFFGWVLCQRALFLDSFSYVNTVPVVSSPVSLDATSSYNGLKGGYDMHTAQQSNKDAYFKLAADGGAKFARDGINWAEFEYTKGKYSYTNTDIMMKAAAKQNIRLLLLLGGSPNWETGSSNITTPPKNPADFANFVTQVVKRYGSKGTFWTENPTVPKVLPVGIEIWNEPNGTMFWGNTTPNPAQYVPILKAAYTASKAVDPTLPVLTAGLGSGSGYNDINCDGKADSGTDSTGMTGMNYLEGMYKAGAQGYFDAVSWHSYIFGNVNAAAMMAYAKCSGWSVMQDTTPSIRSFMAQYGDSAKKVWITETGYPSCTSSYTSPCLSEAEQAKLASLQASAFKTYNWAGLYFWYDLSDDTVTSFEFEKHMGAARGDYSPKPAYTALKSAFSL